MKKFFRNIRKYYKYAVRSAKAELKSEVADSYLNWLWWVIEPLCFMAIYWFVFGVVFNNPDKHFASFVFIGLTAWDFFNRMITGSVKLIVNNRDLVTKVYLPKYILLLSKSFTYLFKMFISLIICFILMAIQGVHPSLYMLFMIPIFLVLYIVAFGIGLILMHFGVTLNDLANLSTIGMRMVFYLSGVFYNINDKLGKFGVVKFLLLRVNPIAFCMNELRKVTIGIGGTVGYPSFEGLAVWFIIGILLCSYGIHIIHKYENSYAKVI